MTEIDSKNLEEMKRFLFHELSDDKREQMEERFFSDEEFFYDLMELENSFVDAYARQELTGEDLKRFEASLEKSPERREKIFNAVALDALIKEEKQTVVKPVVIAEPQPGFWEKISSFFTLQMSAMQYASAALIFLLVCGSSFLLYERIRLNRELAEFQNNQKSIEDLQKQEQNLQNQINESKQREQNLQNQVNDKQGESEILNQQLEREKAERERIENELNRLKNLQKNLPPINRKEIAPPRPTIATVVLSPFLGGRGENNDNAKTIELDSNIKSITFTLQLPKDVKAEMFLVKFKGENLTTKQKPRTTKSGVKFLTVTIPANQFSTGEDNVISVVGNDGVRTDFVLKVQK